MSALPPIPPNVAALTAPLAFGEIFNGYLFGVLSVQVYIYYLTFPADAMYLKALVYGVFAIDTASTLMCLVDTFHWFASGFGSMLALDDIQLSGVDTPFIGSLLAAIAQSFYCYRIYRINPKAWPICVLVLMIAVAEVTAGLYGAIVGTIAKTFSNAADKTKAAIYVIFIGAAVADLLIATTMVTLLTKSRPRHHQQSNVFLAKIVNLTVETNLLSTFLALLTVILLLACPGTNYFTCPSLILGKIYSNSLLLILNNRHYLATGREQSAIKGQNSSGSTYKMAAFQVSNSQPSMQKEGIHVDVNTITGSETESKTVYSRSVV